MTSGVALREFVVRSDKLFILANTGDVEDTIDVIRAALDDLPDGQIETIRVMRRDRFLVDSPDPFPCPIDGNSAQVHFSQSEEIGEQGFYYVQCAICGASMGLDGRFHDERKAIEAWNTRTAP